MKPKILLLSNTMLFHFSFCSFYKNQFDIQPYLLRYLNRNLNSQAEHFYIQIEEQKRKRLYKSGLVGDPNRILLTNKYIQFIVDECNKKQYNRVVLEVTGSSKQELLLIKKISHIGIPISIFTSFIEQEYLKEIHQYRVDSLFQTTDLFNFKYCI